MKYECHVCHRVKKKKKFYKNKACIIGITYICKKCSLIKVDTYGKTKAGVLTAMYRGQINSSIKRGHKPPKYSKYELMQWLYSQNKFHKLFKRWEKSGYKKDLKPSCDRLDDYKRYTFKNIRLTTWEKNLKKSHADMKNGNNTKQCKAVIGIHKVTKEIIKFYSMQQAERETGIHNNAICRCCKGNRKSAGGFIWKYDQG